MVCKEKLEFVLLLSLLEKCYKNVDHDDILEEHVDSLEEWCNEGSGRTWFATLTCW